MHDYCNASHAQMLYYLFFVQQCISLFSPPGSIALPLVHQLVLFVWVVAGNHHIVSLEEIRIMGLQTRSHRNQLGVGFDGNVLEAFRLLVAPY